MEADIFSQIEDQVEQRILDKMGSIVEANVVFYDDEIDAVRYIGDKKSRLVQYPQVLINVGMADRQSAISDRSGDTMSFDITIFIAYATRGSGGMQIQRSTCEQVGMKAIAALTYYRVGTDISSDEPLDDFVLERLFNLEEFCMYRLTASLTLNIDLESIYETLD